VLRGVSREPIPFYYRRNSSALPTNCSWKLEDAELLSRPAPVGGSGEEEELLRVLQGGQAAEGVEVR
jgi:hypothetical protein